MKKLIIILPIFLIFLFWLFFPKGDSELIRLEISKGESASNIVTNLKEQEIIRYEWPFKIYLFLVGEQKNIKAGVYYLSSDMGISKVINQITSGSKEKFTIKEGWNNEQIGDFLNMPNLPEKKPNEFAQEFPFLKEIPEGLSLQGYLFPDTYDIVPGASLESVIRRMLQNFEQKVETYPSFEEITMASLIEKEVRTWEDKRIVSGILWKRMENNIPLQVDATISYITGKRTSRISITETKTESPFNTYLNLGLPWGPICNPGLASIKAALNPKETDYWYYLSKPDGETVFSRNFQEHIRAKNKYLTD